MTTIIWRRLVRIARRRCFTTNASLRRNNNYYTYIIVSVPTPTRRVTRSFKRRHDSTPHPTTPPPPPPLSSPSVSERTGCDVTKLRREKSILRVPSASRNQESRYPKAGLKRAAIYIFREKRAFRILPFSIITTRSNEGVT